MSLSSPRARRAAALVVTAAALLLPSEARAEDARPMRSPGLFGVGVFLGIAGAAGVGAGAYFYQRGSDGCDAIEEMATIPSAADIDACTDSVIEQVGGITGMVTGGAFVLAGVSLMIAGALPAERPAVSVTVGPTGANLSVAF